MCACVRVCVRVCVCVCVCVCVNRHVLLTCFLEWLADVVQDLVDLVKEYLSEGVPLGGLGLQSHVKDFVLPNPTAMWVSVPLNHLQCLSFLF